MALQLSVECKAGESMRLYVTGGVGQSESDKIHGEVKYRSREGLLCFTEYLARLSYEYKAVVLDVATRQRWWGRNKDVRCGVS